MAPKAQAQRGGNQRQLPKDLREALSAKEGAAGDKAEKEFSRLFKIIEEARAADQARYDQARANEEKPEVKKAARVPVVESSIRDVVRAVMASLWDVGPQLLPDDDFKVPESPETRTVTKRIAIVRETPPHLRLPWHWFIAVEQDTYSMRRADGQRINRDAEAKEIREAQVRVDAELTSKLGQLEAQGLFLAVRRIRRQLGQPNPVRPTNVAGLGGSIHVITSMLSAELLALQLHCGHCPRVGGAGQQHDLARFVKKDASLARNCDLVRLSENAKLHLRVLSGVCRVNGCGLKIEPPSTSRCPKHLEEDRVAKLTEYHSSQAKSFNRHLWALSKAGEQVTSSYGEFLQMLENAMNCVDCARPKQRDPITGQPEVWSAERTENYAPLSKSSDTDVKLIHGVQTCGAAHVLCQMSKKSADRVSAMGRFLVVGANQHRKKGGAGTELADKVMSALKDMLGGTDPYEAFWRPRQPHQQTPAYIKRVQDTYSRRDISLGGTGELPIVLRLFTDLCDSCGNPRPDSPARGGDRMNPFLCYSAEQQRKRGVPLVIKNIFASGCSRSKEAVDYFAPQEVRHMCWLCNGHRGCLPLYEFYDHCKALAEDYKVVIAHLKQIPAEYQNSVNFRDPVGRRLFGVTPVDDLIGDDVFSAEETGLAVLLGRAVLDDVERLPEDDAGDVEEEDEEMDLGPRGGAGGGAGPSEPGPSRSKPPSGKGAAGQSAGGSRKRASGTEAGPDASKKRSSGTEGGAAQTGSGATTSTGVRRIPITAPPKQMSRKEEEGKGADST